MKAELLRLFFFAVVIPLAFVGIVTAEPATPVTTRPVTVKVAAVQCSSELGEVEANRRKLMALCEEAAGHGAKIIVLPEASVTGYLSQDLKVNWHLPWRPLEKAYRGTDPRPFAETVPGPSTEAFGALSKRLGVYITVPLVEAEGNADGRIHLEREVRLFNTVCLLSPRGEVVAHYRKLTPWPRPEKSWATAGDRGVVTYDTEYGRVGLAVCYDIHTILPKYAPEHIWALLYPIAWVSENHPAEWFWHQLPEQVGRYGYYLIGANWSVDGEQAWFGYGFSTIISPEGKVIASAKSLHGSEIVYAEIEMAGAARRF